MKCLLSSLLAKWSMASSRIICRRSFFNNGVCWHFLSHTASHINESISFSKLFTSFLSLYHIIINLLFNIHPSVWCKKSFTFFAASLPISRKAKEHAFRWDSFLKGSKLGENLFAFCIRASKTSPWNHICRNSPQIIIYSYIGYSTTFTFDASCFPFPQKRFSRFRH